MSMKLLRMANAKFPPRPSAVYKLNEGGGQVLTDYGGNGYHGQLGGTTGSDTNDPTWSAAGLTFATDDYVKLPLVVDPNQDFTVFVVATIGASAPTAMETYFSFGDQTSGAFAYFKRDTNGDLNFTIMNDATQYAGAALASANVRSGIRLLAVKRSSGKHFVSEVVTKAKSNTATTPTSPITCTKVVMGARYAGGAYDRYLNQPIYYVAIYPRATTDAEDWQFYRAVKRELARKGVTLA